MRRHHRNRLRTWLRSHLFPNLRHGKDCGRGRHRYQDKVCIDCEKDPTPKRVLRWAEP